MFKAIIIPWPIILFKKEKKKEVIKTKFKKQVLYQKLSRSTHRCYSLSSLFKGNGMKKIWNQHRKLFTLFQCSTEYCPLQGEKLVTTSPSAKKYRPSQTLQLLLNFFAAFNPYPCIQKKICSTESILLFDHYFPK